MSRAHPARARSITLTEAGMAAIARDLDRGHLPGQGAARLRLAVTAAGLAAIAAFEQQHMEAAS